MINIEYQKIEDIKVSTKTYIVSTNVYFHLEKIYDAIDVIPYIILEKKRGRKKKTEKTIPENKVEDGSIIYVQYQNKYKGCKKKTKKKTYFRNSITTIMIVDDKKINFKITKNGKIQMTGCKYYKHSQKCIKYFWIYIKSFENICYNFKSENDKIFNVLFIPTMRNIDFSLHMEINREKLDQYINNNTDKYSLLETSFGYTGVNIKFPIQKPITELHLKNIIYMNDNWTELKCVKYSEYLQNEMTESDAAKKINKKRYNTFLVFHSGKCIMSGINTYFMKDAYYQFMQIIDDCYNDIKEVLE